MIGKLSGAYGGLMRDGSILIDDNGVGYSVRVPSSTIGSIEREGAAAALFIHTAMREDAIDLYGFSSEEELSFFRLLMGVSGIGPKSALGIMNAADVVSLKRAIASGDPSLLTRVYGLGQKSAERIVVELRERLRKEGLGGTEASLSAEGEALEALEALGYRKEEAREALAKTESTEGVREKLAAALKYLGSARG